MPITAILSEDLNMQLPTIYGDTFDRIYKKLIELTFEYGNDAKPRGMPIKELIGVKFVLKDPTSSLCRLSKRKLNYRFALVEKMEYVTGESNPERLCHYNNNIRPFINPLTSKFDGAYGPRIMQQMPFIVSLLQHDPDTRQAVININNESDKHDSLDVPCTVSLQFLLRNNQLYLITYMRSNDLLWGTPYDVNGFCFLQEVLAKQLGVELGEYIHVNGSTHAYIERKDKLLCLLNDNLLVDIKNPRVNEPLFDIDASNFWSVEQLVRSGIKPDDVKMTVDYDKLPAYLKTYVSEHLF